MLETLPVVAAMINGIALRMSNIAEFKLTLRVPDTAVE